MSGRRLVAVLLLTATAATAKAAAPEDLIRKAIEYVEGERYALARTYLDPVLVDPRLSPPQRSRAYYLRGYTFLAEGFDVSAARDYERALAIDNGNAEALEALAYLHLEGRGVHHDEAEAFELFLRSARAGHADAKAYVGYALLIGRGTKADINKARFWLQEAADAGDLTALVHLARSYRSLHTDTPDPQRARELYESAAARGAPDAWVGLGYMYLQGELGAADAREAVICFTKAADAHSVEGQSALANLYLTGVGVGQDDRRARALFETAAGSGHPPALTGLAYLHETGRAGFAKDEHAARILYLLAATEGDTAAQLRLTSLYLRDPTEANTREAIRWFRAAAQSGDPSAKNGLAWVLATTTHEALRNGPEAVAIAQEAVAAARSASTLDTLAAAFAEDGQFERALAVQREAIAALTPAEAELTPAFEARLAAYGHRRAWRE